MKCIMRNGKTILSLDLSTNCPKRQAGHPCSYCYVETARHNGWHAKYVHERIPYTGEILRLRKDTITRLNKECGGLRMFSFGDYMPWMDDDLYRVFQDARKVGLRLKALTKRPEFIERFHKYVDIINVSIDNLGEGVAHDVAGYLRERYPNVKVRAAIMSFEDLDALAWADILTLNHALNGYHMFTHKEKAEIAEMYPGKVCCVTGRCSTCKIKCGIQNATSSRNLAAAV